MITIMYLFYLYKSGREENGMIMPILLTDLMVTSFTIFGVVTVFSC